MRSRRRSKQPAARSRSTRRTKTARPTTRPKSVHWHRLAVERLVVAGYVDQGGSGIVRAALDSGAFDTFHFPDGMIGQALEDNFGSEIDGSTGQHPGTDSEGAAMFTEHRRRRVRCNLARSHRKAMTRQR